MNNAHIIATVEGVKPGVYTVNQADIVMVAHTAPTYVKVPEGVFIVHRDLDVDVYRPGDLIGRFCDQHYALLRVAQEQGVEVVIPDD